ncbi:hypothetical protein GGR50DRAFT_393369 [Xylaria sp. CBS 124048]|nr:hypothetical protein GGR50DRAFT_393369 [Xylaria sp. CBS 124048]
MAGLKPYFDNLESPLLAVDPHTELQASLKRITRSWPPVHTCSTGWRFEGFYSGPTSIAFLFYRLSLIYPGMEFGQQTFTEWAEAYLQLGEQVLHPPPTAENCGIANEFLARRALKSVMSDGGFVEAVCSYTEEFGGSNFPNDWLHGRAGYLYFLRLCKKGVLDERYGATIDRAITRTVAQITGDQWTWGRNGILYGYDIGAARGSLGIMTQIALSRPLEIRLHKNKIEALLSMQCPTRNFPAVPGGRDDRVQFCEGGPGFVASLRVLLEYFEDLSDKIRSAIASAQEDIWTRGLLTKEPCLWHGITGNFLAIDNDRRRAHFLSFMASEFIDGMMIACAPRTNVSAGLYTGEAGRAWCWAVADKDLPRTFLGYDDI